MIPSLRGMLVAALGVIATACGTLEVQMAVLDPTVVEEVEARRLLAVQLQEVIGSTPATLNARLKALEAAHFEFYQELAEQYEQESKSSTSDESELLAELASDLKDNPFTPAIRAQYESAQTFLKETEAKIRSIATSFPSSGVPRNDGKSRPEPLTSIEWQLAGLLERRQHRLNELIVFVNQDTNGQLDAAKTVGVNVSASPDVQSALAELAVAIEQTSPTMPLHQDPYAWAVANAEERHWAKTYNEVLGRGRLGNLNIAIMLRDDKNFSLKGVSFDPSDVALIASKVSTQALLLGAQLAGVPVTTQGTSSSDTGRALVTSSTPFEAAEDGVERARAQRAGYEGALLAVANSILAERDHLESNIAAAEARARAVATIRHAHDAQKSRLNMAPACPSLRQGGI